MKASGFVFSLAKAAGSEENLGQRNADDGVDNQTDNNGGNGEFEDLLGIHQLILAVHKRGNGIGGGQCQSQVTCIGQQGQELLRVHTHGRADREQYNQPRWLPGIQKRSKGLCQLSQQREVHKVEKLCQDRDAAYLEGLRGSGGRRPAYTVLCPHVQAAERDDRACVC